jgi:hypothetical protein
MTNQIDTAKLNHHRAVRFFWGLLLRLVGHLTKTVIDNRAANPFRSSYSLDSS